MTAMPDTITMMERYLWKIDLHAVHRKVLHYAFNSDTISWVIVNRVKTIKTITKQVIMMKERFMQIVANKGRLSDEDVAVLTRWYDGNIYNTNKTRVCSILGMLQWLHDRTEDHDSLYFMPGAIDALIQEFSNRFGISQENSKELFNRYIVQKDQSRPCFIAIEGLDGSGKTVQCEKLVTHFKKLGKKVFYIDFPQYESPIGKEIGYFLSGKDHDVTADSIDPKSMCLWYATDRWNALKDVNFAKFDIVLFNRYTLSSAVYQTARYYDKVNTDFINWVFELEHVIMGLPAPDAYLFLDTPISGCSENLTQKGERSYVDGLDVYESSKSLLARSREIYHYCVDSYPSIHLISCNEAGELLPIEEIHYRIVRELNNLGLDI